MERHITNEAPEAEQALPIGTLLSDGQFKIIDNLGAGGFGKTYRAEDTVLGRTVVIKECFYDAFCQRDGSHVLPRSTSFAEPVASIVRMFMREARALAKLRHPNIVGVHRAFEENQTAYMVLDLIEGRDLAAMLREDETPLSPRRIQGILLQLLDAIEKVHDIGLLHRDISPDNILIEQNGTPVLIDFGAARADASRHSRAVSSLLVVKDGYSPQEFYVAGSEQTPASDLYALAATFYHVISGEAPPHSQTRLLEIAARKPDPCTPLKGRIRGYDDAFLEAIDAAMQVHPGDRLQSAAKWRSLIANISTEAGDIPGSKPRAAAPEISLDLERSLTRLVQETNSEVRRTSQMPAQPKPEPAKQDTSQKPAWVSEFNKETAAPPKATGEPSAINASPSLLTNMTQTNWISRAMEKQQQRIEQEQRALGLFVDENDTPPQPTPEIDPMPTNDSPDAPKPDRVYAVLRLVAGVVLCFSFVFFFELR